MSLWIIIPLAVWLIGFVIFLIAIYREAPKQQAPIMGIHYLVALGWPLWLVWYLWAVIDDRINRGKPTDGR